ncbi:MAG: porin family protein [Prevotella sp.]|nr:porin family protein [Prevotella sp.]
MKKLFLTMCVALLSMSAFAQEKGDFAVGVRSGVNIMRFKFASLDETSTNFGIGAFGQYSLSDHWRLELDGIYNPTKDHVSNLALGLNVHYLFKLGDAFRIYPSVGYSLAFVHSEAYTMTTSSGEVKKIESENDTDGGIQLGAGIQYNINKNWFVAGEYKYQPGLFGDGQSIMGSIGYRF